MSTENAENRINEANWDVNPRSNGWKERERATKKATDVVPLLLSDAISAGITADYVLFDSWFSTPKEICAVKEKNLDVVAMVRKTEKVHYRFQGKNFPAKPSINNQKRDQDAPVIFSAFRLKFVIRKRTKLRRMAE